MIAKGSSSSGDDFLRGRGKPTLAGTTGVFISRDTDSQLQGPTAIQGFKTGTFEPILGGFAFGAFYCALERESFARGIDLILSLPCHPVSPNNADNAFETCPVRTIHMQVVLIILNKYHEEISEYSREGFHEPEQMRRTLWRLVKFHTFNLLCTKPFPRQRTGRCQDVCLHGKVPRWLVALPRPGATKF